MEHETYDKATVLRQKIRDCQRCQDATNGRFPVCPSPDPDTLVFRIWAKIHRDRKDLALANYLNLLDEDERNDVSNILDQYYTKRLTALESQFSSL